MTGHDENRVMADLDDASIPILAKPVRPAELRSTIFAQLVKRHRAGAALTKEGADKTPDKATSFRISIASKTNPIAQLH